MKKLLSAILLMCFAQASLAQTQPEYRITEWYQGKKAAVTLTFDDNLPGHTEHAIPIMNERNLVGSFYLITNQVGNWTNWKAAADSGHEIGSHSATSPHLRQQSESKIDQEFSTAKTKIQSEIGSMHGNTIAWPFGEGGGGNDTLIRRVAEKYYIGARSASVNSNGFDGYKPWTSSQFYLRIGAKLMDQNVSAANLSGIVRNAAKEYGWVVPMYHAIENSGYATVPKALFTETMDSLAAMKDEVWVTTFYKAQQYHQQRASATLSAIAETDSTWTLQLTDNLSDGALFNHPLTIRLKVPSGKAFKSVMLNGAHIPVAMMGDSMEFHAFSNAGPIVLSTDGTVGLAKAENTVKPLQVYPQPASEFVEIRAEENFSVNADLRIISATGQAIEFSSGKRIEGNKIRLDVSNLAKGFYVVELVQNEAIYRSRLLIQR